MNNDYTSVNILSEKKAICDYCNNVVEISIEKKDAELSNILKIKNVDVYVCNDCKNTVGVPHDTEKTIIIKTKFFKEERKSISELLKNAGETKYRWCESFACGCVGAANCSGRLSDNLYTKNEWILWKHDNKEITKPSYIISFEIPENKRMAINKILRIFLSVGSGCVGNILDLESPEFLIDYDSQSDDFIALDLSILKRLFTSVNVEYVIKETDSSDYYSNQSYARVEN
jgi:hypothetical protein